MTTKIVFLGPIGQVGGAERVLLEMLAALRIARPSWELHVILGAAGPLAERVQSLGASCRVLPLPSSVATLGEGHAAGTARWKVIAGLLGGAAGAAAYTWRLRRELARLNPQIVHSNGAKFHLLSAWARPRSSTLIWHLHDFLAGRKLTAKLLAKSCHRATAGLAISQAVARDASQALPGLPIEVLLNTVDVEHYTPGPNDGAELDLLADMSSPPEPCLRVGLVATYARWKGHELVLDAAAKLCADPIWANRLRFFLIGGPVYQTAHSQYSAEELQAAIAQRGLQDCVGLIPFQPDPLPIYRNLDVVLQASTLPEPFGLTIAEAMACGRTIIAPNAGGAAELFTAEVDGMGYPPGDAAALAAAIARVAADAELRTRLGQNARQSALARFARQRLQTELPALYEQIAKHPLP